MKSLALFLAGWVSPAGCRSRQRQRQRQRGGFDEIPAGSVSAVHNDWTRQNMDVARLE